MSHCTTRVFCPTSAAGGSNPVIRGTGPSTRRLLQHSQPILSTSRATQSDDQQSTAPTQDYAQQSWRLMGRVVSEDKVPFSQVQQRALIVQAAANEMGLSVDDFLTRLQEVMALLPDMADRLMVLQPSLLAALCADTAAVAQKLITLRRWFPKANVSMMVMKRPNLLLDHEFDRVPEAALQLKELFPGADIDALVSQQPLLLVEDIKSIVAHLKLMMPGVDVATMLLRNPSVLLSAQRGTRHLGPGAEFM